MTNEPLQPVKEEVVPEVTPQEVINELNKELINLQFFSDQIRFNSIMYQGMNLLLEKITKIEEKLNGKA